MSLNPATRLGSYEVLASIGEGGMGEVYRARDTKLNRDVALKVLPDLVAGGGKFLPMEGDATRGWTAGKPTVFRATPALEVGPMFSPDGRFIAYMSNEASGGAVNDVYVRPFPGPGGP